MNAKGFWVGGIIAVLAGALIGAYYLWGGTGELPDYTPPATEPAGEGVIGSAAGGTDPFDVTITYTDKGFSPADITVTQGTRVRFLNASQEPMWPASGVHPTHTLYPEKQATNCLGSSFDACQEVALGEFYDFTFYHVGRWPYHDHSHAYHTGSVTVTP